MNKPKISIVVLNWNGKKYLRKCVKSVLNQNFYSTEVIVIDNDSKDGSLDTIKDLKVKIIKNDKNRGSAGGYNLGFANSQGDYVVLISHATVLDKNCIRALYEGMEEDTSLGMAEGECTMHDGEIYNSNVNMLMFNTPMPQNDTRKFYAGLPTILRKEAMDTYTDSGYFFYGDDIYSGWLAQIKGWKCKRILEAKCKHIGSTSQKTKPKLYRFYDERNRWLNFLFFPEAKNVLLYLPINIAFSIGKMLNGIRRGYAPYYFLAYFGLIFDWYYILRKRMEIQRQRKVSDKCLMTRISKINNGLLRTQTQLMIRNEN